MRVRECGCDKGLRAQNTSHSNFLPWSINDDRKRLIGSLTSAIRSLAACHAYVPAKSQAVEFAMLSKSWCAVVCGQPCSKRYPNKDLIEVLADFSMGTVNSERFRRWKIPRTGRINDPTDRGTPACSQKRGGPWQVARGTSSNRPSAGRTLIFRQSSVSSHVTCRTPISSSSPPEVFEVRTARVAPGTRIPLAASNFGRAVSSDAAKTLRHARPSQRRTKSSAAPGVAAGGVCTTVFGEACCGVTDASTVIWCSSGMRASGCHWRGDRVAAKGANPRSANARMRCRLPALWYKRPGATLSRGAVYEPRGGARSAVDWSTAI